MIQTTQLNNITAEQNNLVKIRQGGTLNYGIGRIYWNYDFVTLNGYLYNPELAKIYAEIGKDFAVKVSINCVVKMFSDVKMSTPAKKNIWGRWTPPTYNEDRLITFVKENLKVSGYGDCIWADYLWYAEFQYRSPITNMMVISRDYSRQIHILSEKINFELIRDINDCRIEDGSVAIQVYPHTNINHLENDKETVRSYVHNDDFIVKIGFNDKWTGITIQPNPKHMNYEQLIEIIEPIFEEHGLKLKDRANPYSKDGFSLEEEYTQHREYPCAGYRFFD